MKLHRKYLKETVVVGNYPDTGGIASDDDMPPGNINYGPRYERKPYSNKLTGYNSIWDVDDSDNWMWNWFENSTGMEDRDNYSDTLKKLAPLYGDRLMLHTKSKSDAQRDKDLRAMNKEVLDEPLGDDPVSKDIVEKINGYCK